NDSHAVKGLLKRLRPLRVEVPPHREVLVSACQYDCSHAWIGLERAELLQESEPHGTRNGIAAWRIVHPQQGHDGFPVLFQQGWHLLSDANQTPGTGNVRRVPIAVMGYLVEWL